jgi:hypothetical protein
MDFRNITIKLVLGLTLFLQASSRLLASAEPEEISRGIAALLAMNSREISPSEKTRKIITTVTTIPQRLQRLAWVLHTLDWELVDEVHINIPLVSLRGVPYDETHIEQIQQLHKKINIFRIEEDFGPITKILPTLERFIGQDVLLFSLDDDTAYPKGMWREGLYWANKYPHCIFGGSGHSIGNEKIPETSKCRDEMYRTADDLPESDLIPQGLIEGFGGVVVPSKLFTSADIAFLKAVVLANNKASASINVDDMVLSLLYAKKEIPRFMIDNNFFNRRSCHDSEPTHLKNGSMWQFPHGKLEEHGIHKGGLLSPEEKQNLENPDHVLDQKNRESLSELKIAWTKLMNPSVLNTNNSDAGAEGGQSRTRLDSDAQRCELTLNLAVTSLKDLHQCMSDSDTVTIGGRHMNRQEVYAARRAIALLCPQLMQVATSSQPGT